MQYGEKRELATCEACGRNYQWQTGKGARQQRLYTPNDFALEIVSKTKPGNLIAQPYSAICSEVKSRRFDMVLARQFAKQARKLTSSFKIEYPLIEHRKTVRKQFGHCY